MIQTGLVGQGQSPDPAVSRPVACFLNIVWLMADIRCPDAATSPT